MIHIYIYIYIYIDQERRGSISASYKRRGHTKRMSMIGAFEYENHASEIEVAKRENNIVAGNVMSLIVMACYLYIYKCMYMLTYLGVMP